MKFWVIFITLIVGIALGVIGTIFGPDLIAPHLPEAIQREVAKIEGTVVTKKREGEQLLLTIGTPQGTVLATFKEKVAEIDHLVSEGDLLTLALRQYKPFVEDPVIGRVKKQEPKQQQGGEPS